MNEKLSALKKVQIAPIWAALIFTFLLIVFEAVLLDTNYLDYVRYLRQNNDFDAQLSAFSITIGAIGCFFIFSLYAFSAARYWKIFYLVFFVVALFFEYGYQKALGRFTNWRDLDAVIQTTSEQKTTAILYYFNLEVFIPIAFFILFLIISKTEKPYKIKGLVITCAVFAVFYFNVSYISDFFADRKFPTVSMNAFCRSTADFLYFGDLIDGSSKVRKAVAAPPITTNYKPNNNVIVIMDESILGNHLSINGYQRDTTPFLKELEKKGVLHNFGIAVAGTTASQTSYDVLVTGTTPDEIPDRRDLILRKSPTLFQYAKAMNYKTYFLDGQMIRYWGGIPDDLNYIDEFVGVENFANADRSELWNVDTRIAQHINKIITESTGNFIFVFKRGNHIPYHHNFPDEATVWQPSSKADSTINITPEQIIEETNAYDNALRFNIDSFFQKMIADYANIPNNTKIIYTGDHGQTLFEGGRSSHAGRTKPEANVPLFIVGNLEKIPDSAYKASHCNILPTVLDLLEFPEDKRYKKYALSLLRATAADNQPRYFNPSLEAKVPFDE